MRATRAFFVVQDYHKVRAWQKAHALAISIRRLTETFPRTGYAHLRKQMIRSAESIADNIAEGCGAATNAEFARFLDMSIKSASELENQIDRAHGYRILRANLWRAYGEEVRTVRKMTWGFRQTIVRADEAPPDPPKEAEQKTGRKADDGERSTESG